MWHSAGGKPLPPALVLQKYTTSGGKGLLPVLAQGQRDPAWSRWIVSFTAASGELFQGMGRMELGRAVAERSGTSGGLHCQILSFGSGHGAIQELQGHSSLSARSPLLLLLPLSGFRHWKHSCVIQGGRGRRNLQGHERLPQGSPRPSEPYTATG